MGLSLRKGYGLDNKSLSGDFASKMWSSYTQLNPGVYSDAIATEFKRRMKPDYVENLVLNGGGLNATEWLGTTLPNNFAVNTGYEVTFSRVTGNGFSGTACRLVENNTNRRIGIYTSNSVMVSGVSYTISGYYRSSTPIDIREGAGGLISNLATNTGDALAFSVIFTATVTTTLYFLANILAASWIELGNLTMIPTISQNYFTIFGPSGLNKTTADWIGIMVTANNTLAGANTKTGAVMKWNLDGTIVTQNNLPAYTKGANAGIITFTSIDTFLNLTTFDCKLSNLIHLSGLYSAVNIVVLNCRSNKLGYLTTYAWIKLVDFQCYSNLLTSINNTGSNKISVDNEQLNLYSTEMVNSRLAYYNAMFAVTPPINNLTLNLSGATMGIPTGAGSNTDLLGILAKFTAAGFTATIIVRTS